jgi:uncharacterized coiled-coil DUF342 family protein
VSAWTEAESARKEALSAREHVASQAEEVQQWRLELGQVIRERDQPRSHAAEVVSGAEVLGGQLAEATERPAEASARARTLAENLAMRAQARCRASSFEVEILPPVSPSEAGPDSAEGGNDTEGAAPPPADV